MASSGLTKIKSIIPPPKARPIIGWIVTAGLTDKTVKVRIPFISMLPKLKKRVVKNTILLAHDAENACDPGDKVELAKSRPYSKRKHHIVKTILVKDPAADFLQKHPEYRLNGRDLRLRREAALEAEQRYKQEAAFAVLKQATTLSDSQRASLEQQITAATATTTAASSATSIDDDDVVDDDDVDGVEASADAESDGATSAPAKPKSKKKLLTEVLEDSTADKSSGKGSKAAKRGGDKK